MRYAAQQELTRYLAHFPDEFQRLTALQAQLLDPAGEDIFARTTMRGHITASALVLSADHSKLLLIHHRIIGRWLQPGGHVEPGQDLWASACREVAEETGVSAVERLALGPLGAMPIDIDSHAIAANPRKGEAAHWHHDFLYLARADDSIALQAQLDEVHAVRWAPLAWLAEAGEARWRLIAAKLQAFI
ncbi:NUDIX hydrolase [Roseateles toxinivorans]|uniref:8-oxo-dGTP pyrophosphatase MutT (NUDIX family) n=1 Tax=Roseateles toxinivorans TaxID=270368 RepID=A0A4R6QLX4_9BURK|nr:NUDIX hydrolase [Roseateles toxinivorans]TDP71303.1 8-oxo-dGTP pyrophosphatase MutT (NUDIX family) [Roseateles toxinivorans]